MKKIYTILERIYSEDTTNVFNYDNEKLAKKNFRELKKYYKENYGQYYKTGYKTNNYLCMDDIACVELFENDINKDIL